MSFKSILCFLAYLVISIAVCNLEVADLRTRFLLQSKFRLSLACSILWTSEPPGDVWFRNYEAKKIYKCTCSTTGSIDLKKCQKSIQTSIGEHGLGTCSNFDRNLTITINLSFTSEEDLGKWVCIAHFTSSHTYINASSLYFRERSLLDLKSNMNRLDVVKLKEEENGLMTIGCRMESMGSSLQISEANATGVPFKIVKFQIGETLYEGDIYGRSSILEYPNCVPGNRYASSVCFMQQNLPLGSTDPYCSDRMITFFKEQGNNEDPSVKFFDRTIFFAFPRNVHSPGYEIKINSIIVMEDRPSYVGCYPIAHSDRYVCLSLDNVISLIHTLLELASKYTEMIVKPTKGKYLTCDGGEIVVVTNNICIGKKSSSCSDHAFFILRQRDSLSLLKNYEKHLCIGSHFYCFKTRRNAVRKPDLVVVTKTGNSSILMEQPINEIKVKNNCYKRETPVNELLEAYTDAYSRSIGLERNNFETIRTQTTPIKRCPCVQIPKACSNYPPVIASLMITNLSKMNELTSCSFLGKTSELKLLRDVLEPCSDNLSLFAPTLRSMKVTNKNRANEELLILYCKETKSCTAHSNISVSLTLSNRRWMDRVQQERHYGNSILVDPIILIARYQSISCRYGMDKKESSVGQVFRQFERRYMQVNCYTQNSYKFDIWLANKTSIQCIVRKMSRSCPSIKVITLEETSCTHMECQDRNKLTISLKDLSDSKNFTCSIQLLHDNQVYTYQKTYADIKKDIDCVSLKNLHPEIQRKGLRNGDEYITCRYPWNTTTFRHCDLGIRIATIELKSISIEREEGLFFSRNKPKRMNILTWITYTLNALHDAEVNVQGFMKNQIKAVGFTLPDYNVLKIKISKNYFRSLAETKKYGINVKANCFFSYSSKKLASKTAYLYNGILAAYELEKMLSIHSNNHTYNKDFYQEFSVRRSFYFHESHWNILSTFLYISSAAIIILLCIIICISPRYRIN